MLLLVVPDRAESELDASVERLFDEGGSGNQTEQVDSASGGKDADIQRVIEAVDTVVEDLKEDYGTPSGTPVSGKSRSTLKRLLPRAVLNAEVEVAAIPTLPFMTASISSTPKHKGRDHTDSVVGPNLHAIGTPPRFIISSDSFYHSDTNVAEAEVDSLIRSSVPIMTTVTTITSTIDPASVTKKKLVKPSPFFVDSSSAGGTDPTTGVFSDLTSSNFLVGAIRIVIDPDTDLQKVYVPQWSVTNGSRLDDGRICREIVDEFAPPKFFASIRGIEHNQLFIEFNVGATCQMSLSAEVRMRVEYNVKEKRWLKSVAERHVELLKVREGEIENLKTLRGETNALKENNAILEKDQNALDVKVTELKASAVGKERKLTHLNALIITVKSQNNILVDRIRTFILRLQEKVTVYENCMDQLEKFQDDLVKVVNDKFDKLYNDFVEMALHLEEKFYPHLLTTVFGRRWLLTHGMELAIVKCLNSPEYLSALGAVIGPAIKKGMQDGLSTGTVHGKEGRLRNVNFSLLAELKSYKDASVETVMDILRLEGPLAEKLGLNELQPNVDQLMVPIHFSPDKVILVAEGTSDIAPTTANTNMALSITFDFTSSIAPISVDDYEVVGSEDQAIVDENTTSFPNVDDAELNIP
uniref:Transposase (Putative), gypsy type n=1 Tax=Tanacetum cinerariifolium TaxID=118510 RepID=A0A699HLD9_TANCI|nr:hypothetical protein [Tanacetum cinerariifolium]